ncbi:hypothetical protein [Tenacibaculum sp. 190524A02b]|uniref:hypothetical protein n=1 Tax=Tenacibaculum vairaonense TaxID=3137860 RepID=UPI0031FA8658
MIFVNDLTSDKPLNTFNNNVIEFKASDSIKAVRHALVFVNGIKYELTPNLNNIFRFNFIQTAKVLNNLSYFKDTVEFDVTKNIIYHDLSLYNELNLQVKIVFEDGTEEVETKLYKFLNSVEQILRLKNDVDTRLYPLTQNNLYISYLTYFEGYPFDISFYSNSNREIKVRNKSTLHEITFEVTKGVNRFLISDGKTNISIENILPLHIGTNDLEFKIGDEVLFTVILNKVDAKCGVYLKWFNASGGYSYWLLTNNEERSIRTKTISEINTDFESFAELKSNISITGKNVIKTKRISSQLLSENEANYLEEIFSSPKVELLNDSMYLFDKDWIGVKVLDGRVKTLSSKKKKRFFVSIQLPKLYTQKL